MLDALNVFNLHDIGQGLIGVIQPFPLMLMVIGVVIASFFAAAPGIGGLLLLSLLMPYAMTLDPFAFIALIFGAATGRRRPFSTAFPWPSAERPIAPWAPPFSDRWSAPLSALPHSCFRCRSSSRWCSASSPPTSS